MRKDLLLRSSSWCRAQTGGVTSIPSATIDLSLRMRPSKRESRQIAKGEKTANIPVCRAGKLCFRECPECSENENVRKTKFRNALRRGLVLGQRA